MVEFSPGSIFAGHRIEAIAGRGGMGVVYRASQLDLGRTVALKVIAPELAEDPRLRDRFVNESRVAASIDHPNVIPIFYTGEEQGVLFIAMRYVLGTDLRRLVRAEGRLDAQRALRASSTMNKRPENRFPSAGDVARAALAAALDRPLSEPERTVAEGSAAPWEGSTISGPGPMRPAEASTAVLPGDRTSWMRAHARLLGWGVGVLVVALVSVTVALSSGEDPSPPRAPTVTPTATASPEPGSRRPAAARFVANVPVGERPTAWRCRAGTCGSRASAGRRSRASTPRPDAFATPGSWSAPARPMSPPATGRSGSRTRAPTA
jgi:hypothetical protein